MGTPSDIAYRPDPVAPVPSATIGPDASTSTAAVWSLARNDLGTAAVCPAGIVTSAVFATLPPPSCRRLTVACTLVLPSFTRTSEGTGSSPNAEGRTTQAGASVFTPPVAASSPPWPAARNPAVTVPSSVSTTTADAPSVGICADVVEEPPCRTSVRSPIALGSTPRASTWAVNRMPVSLVTRSDSVAPPVPPVMGSPHREASPGEASDERIPPLSRTTADATAIRPRAAVTSTPTIDWPSAPTFCEPIGKATDDPAGTVRSVQALLRTGGSSGRYRVTSITASIENGFITTKKECELWVVTASTTSQREPGVDVHGSAPSPGSFAPPHTAQPTAAQPPKTSTRVDAALDEASTCFRTSSWGGTETSLGLPTGPSAYEVIRASSVAPVGFATSIVAVQPGPPPCGQSQVVEGAVPAV